ncbi:hypothetical protein [Cucumibacter marinus]|uniref:hypothetical protein n=1 Tax=Cucumibacter marinus TaxID=1121252 RepID=UPI000422A6F9|nr:hypothetical protein [Cucumibacter marinus]
METIIALIIQAVAGGVGGVGTGQVAKNVSLGQTGNIIAGVIGGVGGTWLAGIIPGLEGLVGAGGLDAGAIVGQAVTGLVGGGILTGIAGFAKNAMGGK